MTSMLSAENINKSMNGLNPLLPHVAGIIEQVQDITFADIKKEVETDLERKVSDSEVVKAIENGIGLGVFNVEREFKVRREFTTREINKEALEKKLTEAAEEYKMSKPRWRKNLMKQVRHEREKRTNRMIRKSKRARNGLPENEFCNNATLYEYLCQRCKDSLEKELSLKGSDLSSENDEGEGYDSNAGSSSTVNSNAENRFKSKRAPGKSKLLIEKNPMETDQPYYDIFT